MQIENILIFLPISEQIEFENISYLNSFISPERTERIKHYRFGVDKKISLYAELIVRLVACKMLDIANSDLRFEKNKSGKPFLKGVEGFKFNISHTKNAVIVAVSSTEVGTDIEIISVVDEKIAKRFFTENEQSYILSDNKNANLRFFEVWTKKEAYLKYLGDGLNISMRSFDVFSPAIANNLTMFINECYIVTICTEWKDKDFKIITLSEEELIDDISKKLK